MKFEIRADKKGKPFLKKIEGYPNTGSQRTGVWVEIGRPTDYGIENAIRTNVKAGYSVCLDEYNVYRILVLTD